MENGIDVTREAVYKSGTSQWDTIWWNSTQDLTDLSQAGDDYVSGLETDLDNELTARGQIYRTELMDRLGIDIKLI